MVSCELRVFACKGLQVNNATVLLFKHANVDFPVIHIFLLLLDFGDDNYVNNFV